MSGSSSPARADATADFVTQCPNADGSLDATFASGGTSVVDFHEIRKAAPNLSVAHANTADTANSAKIATNVFSANVRGDGSLLGSIPAGATSSRNATGDYRISFGRSIAGCTIAASLANTTTQLGIVGVGVIDATTLQVFTRSEANIVEDRGFYVQAICPV